MAEYRELNQTYIDRARKDHFIAEQLAEEARLRSGPRSTRRRRRSDAGRAADAEEREKRALLEQGVAVAVNLRRHGNLIAWAKERGLFVRVDRATPWGNPFVLGRNGDRATVIACYRDHYLPLKPSLLGRLGELRSKALGCWCAPEPCHADMHGPGVWGPN